MDRGLLTRALIVGFICFILAAVGFNYLSLMAEQSNRQYREMHGAVSSDSAGIAAMGLLMLVAVGFFVLVIVCGAVTALISAPYWERWHDIFLASALAGGTPVMLFWVVFWCLTLANIIGAALDHEPFGSSDLIFFLCIVVINILVMALSVLIAGVSGYATRTIAREIVRLSG